jgi:thiol-disulfide isomerase/thioredoxin
MNSSLFQHRMSGRPTGLRLHVLSFVIAVVAAVAASPVASSKAADSSPTQPILHLANDSFLPGRPLDTDQPDVLLWQNRSFTKPFHFPLSGVSTAEFPVVLPRPKPSGEYCIELSSGDVIYGNILEFSESTLQIQAANTGSIHVNRASIQRIYRWKQTSLIYLGPNGLDGWDYAMPGIPAGDIWTSEGGWPRTTTPNASLFRDFGLPARAAIEFELSWNDMPDFELVLGPRNLRGIEDAVGPAPAVAPIEDEFRFEVWDGELVVVGESKRDADVASVTPIAGGPGAVRVQLYLDQEKQQLYIYSRNGQQSASVKLHSRKPEIRGGLRLTNREGHIRLKHLRITHWDGILPQDVQADKSRIHQTDGKIIYGQVTAFDPQSNEFILKQNETTILVDADTVSDVFLSPAVATTELPKPAVKATSETPADSPSGQQLVANPVPAFITSKIVCQDSSQYSGHLTGIRNGSIQLNCENIDEPLKIPLTAIRSIARQSSGTQASYKPTTSGRGGRLELDGVKLQGRLLSGIESPDASCLVWHPDFSSNSSPMAKELSGRIVYRDPPKPVKKVTVTNIQRQIVIRQINRKPAIQGFGDVFKQMLTGKIAPAKTPKIRGPQTLHLRSGDTIPCEVISVDEDGLHLTTPLSDATFVSNDRIKGVELDGKLGSPTLDETKRKRLLTLPRLQKGSPPTHLIYSVNDDFLRGRLVGMSDDMLTVEVRLTNREIPRDRVSQIIWLHADELESDGKPNQSAAEQSAVVEPEPTALTTDASDKAKEPEATRIQTLVRRKDRLTFFATKIEDASLISGTSDILGECHSEIADVDQLLIGDYIEQAAAQLAYHRWKLHYATEPKFVLAGDGETAPITGTESPLVGHPAPDFKLADLSGDNFQLAEHRGEVIVLDFWATWCSPCLQTMPLVDEIVREFPDQKVRLLAVNMEEQPAEIKSTLERHKLDVPVILDIDGVAAARYSVTSIPQTVVIDREGNVARLFIGGGPKLAEPLRQAIKELTDPQPTSDDANASETATEN